MQSLVTGKAVIALIRRGAAAGHSAACGFQLGPQNHISTSCGREELLETIQLLPGYLGLYLELGIIFLIKS